MTLKKVQNYSPHLFCGLLSFDSDTIPVYFVRVKITAFICFFDSFSFFIGYLGKIRIPSKYKLFYELISKCLICFR